jgi:hypothetical protein
MKQIFQAIYDNVNQSINDVETAPKTNQSYQVGNQSISPQISAFCHNNPMSLIIKERKEAEKLKDPTKTVREKDKEKNCS